MKFFATVAAIVIAVTTAQEALTTSGIKVISGSSPQKIMPSTSSGVSVSSVAVPQPAAIDVRLGASDVLNRGVGLVNKNTIATDNNVYITNSNLLFRQSDRIALARKVESFVLSEAAAGADATTMSSNVMRIVSSAGGSDVTMAKASGVNVGVISDKAQAVVAAAQSGSTSDLRQRIMDLVSLAMGS